MSQPVPSIAITEATTTVLSRDCAYMGCVIKAGGTGAVANIRAGSATGVLLDGFVLAANAVYVHGVPVDGGLRASGGVYVEVISGSFTGAVEVL